VTDLSTILRLVWITKHAAQNFRAINSCRGLPCAENENLNVFNEIQEADISGHDHLNKGRGMPYVRRSNNMQLQHVDC